jgi:hypothetical protein
VRRKLVCAVIVIAILTVGVLYVSGYEVDLYHFKLNPAPGPKWNTLLLESSSGETIAELNVTSASFGGNTTKGVSFGFQLWHAKGYIIEQVNMTIAVGPFPADVWVTAFNYDTGGYPPLDFENANFSGGPTGVSGAVLTLSGFPAQNPTTLYGVGLAYKDAELPAQIGSTTILVQFVLTSTSGIPFVGDSYAGQVASNLVYLGNLASG